MSEAGSDRLATALPVQQVQRRGAGFWKRYARNRPAVAGLAIVSLLVMGAIFAPWLAPYHFDNQDLMNTLTAPGDRYLLGGDQFGRDLLSRIIYGSRASLEVGIIATGISMCIGVVLGALAGYFGGKVDYAIEAVLDITWAFPIILFALFLVSMIGPSLTNVMIAVGLVSWAEYARIVRAQILSLREQEFIVAAKVVGSSHLRILFRHLLPNALSPVIVLATLGMANAILAEAGLSFLGLGVQPPQPSWGSILSNGRDFQMLAPWLTIFPGLAITIIILGFNLMGDGLRDALDPWLRD